MLRSDREPLVNWPENQFKLGINMAGAVSAGAYTAGVIDFLVEALEEWQTRKDALRAWLAQPVGAAPELVPLHDVSIEIFSGASAGGMCAAIASVMVQQDFVHIRTGQETNTNNTFYEAWVNRIDIRELLKTQDMDSGAPLTSILDSTIIDEIAESALTPGITVPRPYISPQLTLMLTLTNVRGTPYQLYEDPAPGIEEFTRYYGDKLQFETTVGSAPPVSVGAKPLPAGAPGTGAWPLLKLAAKATGAVPLVLAPRIIDRDVADYIDPPWTTPCTAPTAPVNPAFPVPPPVPLQTLNVDGGVTDNDPFDLAHDFLAFRNSQAQKTPGDCQNPRPAAEANCAVITVAPFPALDKFDPGYSPQAESGIWRMLGKLIDVLISQSRFLGESLAVLATGTAFSQFVIAPSDDDNPDIPALQCASLGAFGGFFARDFRAHDFLLGRRNCQQFLKTHFLLPTANPVIAAGLQSSGSLSAQIEAAFLTPAPSVATSRLGYRWLPLIPCKGTAETEVPSPPRSKLANSDLDSILDLIVNRIKAIKSPLLVGAPGIVSCAVGLLLAWPTSTLIKTKLRAAIAKGLGSNLEGQ